MSVHVYVDNHIKRLCKDSLHQVSQYAIDLIHCHHGHRTENKKSYFAKPPSIIDHRG